MVLSQSLRFRRGWVCLLELLKQQSDDHCPPQKLASREIRVKVQCIVKVAGSSTTDLVQYSGCGAQKFKSHTIDG